MRTATAVNTFCGRCCRPSACSSCPWRCSSRSTATRPRTPRWSKEFGLLSSTQVAQRAKSKSLASNPAALANRWRREQKVVAVDVDGVQRFPGFQFGGNGRPLPVIADVLAAVGDRLTGWALALWFTGGSGWLGGERPVDALVGDSELVVEAASRLAAEILL